MVKLKIGKASSSIKKKKPSETKKETYKDIPDEEIEEIESEIEEQQEEIDLDNLRVEDFNFDDKILEMWEEKYPNKNIIYHNELTKQFWEFYLDSITNCDQLRDIPIHILSKDFREMLKEKLDELEVEDMEDAVEKVKNGETPEEFKEEIKDLTPTKKMKEQNKHIKKFMKKMGWDYKRAKKEVKKEYENGLSETWIDAIFNIEEFVNGVPSDLIHYVDTLLDKKMDSVSELISLLNEQYQTSDRDKRQATEHLAKTLLEEYELVESKTGIEIDEEDEDFGIKIDSYNTLEMCMSCNNKKWVSGETGECLECDYPEIYRKLSTKIENWSFDEARNITYLQQLHTIMVENMDFTQEFKDNPNEEVIKQIKEIEEWLNK